MSKKYLPDSSTATLITNDLFLASFLVSVGCTLSRVEKNARRRVSFVFTGERVGALREAYRTGPVQVDMRDFRDNLNRLRDLLGGKIGCHTPEERSVPCPRVPEYPQVPMIEPLLPVLSQVEVSRIEAFPMQLSRA